MSSKKLKAAASAGPSIQKSAVEDSILSDAGVHTLDPLHQVPSSHSIVGAPAITTRPVVSAAPLKRKELDKSEADAREIKLPEDASAILGPYAGTYITFPSRRKVSTYYPSSLMMDYQLHHVNSLLVDNYYFLRSCPDYHPYILRLYYGVLFWIQIIRANVAASNASISDTMFLKYFLEQHPVGSLPIVGPLMPTFMSLSASRPEIDAYGYVVPFLPTPGPARRDDFFKTTPSWGMLPNVPGIIALLEHLNGLINGQAPTYPEKGQHIPISVTSPANTVFGHHPFPAALDRTDDQKWALCSSGLQYPCEADDRLNEAFAERYDNFDFPTTEPEDETNRMHEFLSLDTSTAWFTHVKNVAAAAANYFEGSGTLANCDPTACCANQFIVEYERPPIAPPAPTQVADPRSLFPFSIVLQTTVRNPPPLCEAISSMAQTNVIMFEDHPKYGLRGAEAHQGDFWNIRPIETAPSNPTAYLEVPRVISKMMKERV